MFVIDASTAAAWLFDDESEPRADAALARVAVESAIVPQHWHLEIRNALLVAERRRRLPADAVPQRLRLLQTLPIRTDIEPDLDRAYEFARSYRLSFYDAVYLELAVRHGAALATLDMALSRAAGSENVIVVA